jgi:type III pantothenate kinase
MLLAIDIGNSNIVFGLYGSRGWIDHWRIHTDHNKMPDEYAVLFRDILREESVAREAIGTTIISSVVPHLTEKIREVTQTLTGKDPLIVGPGIKTGIKIRTDNPSEVGSDLVCNAVAAYERVKGNCIVVDFGTALTFTAVNDKGDLMGVAIAPGIQAGAGALAASTAQLPQVWLQEPEHAIGKNTTQSIRSGILFGYAGLVEGLIRRIRAELGGEATVIATGGRASVIAPLTDCITLVEPWLILEGLRLIAERNNWSAQRSV